MNDFISNFNTLELAHLVALVLIIFIFADSPLKDAIWRRVGLKTHNDKQDNIIVELKKQLSENRERLTLHLKNCAETNARIEESIRFLRISIDRLYNSILSNKKE